LKEIEEQQQFKYRTKNHEMETQDEVDEKLFKEMFPDFTKEFADLKLDEFVF
jgi:hypothetical protein